MTGPVEPSSRSPRHRPSAGRCLPAPTPRSLLVRAVLLAIASIAIGAWSAARGAEPNLDELADAFVAIVETAEFGARPRGVAKWSRPISVAVVGRPEPDQLAALEDLFARVAGVANLSLRRVAPIAGPPPGAADPQQPLDFAQPDGVFQILTHLPGNDWTVYTVSGRREAIFVWRAHLTVIFAPHAVFARLARIQRFDPKLVARIDAGGTPCAANYFVDPASHEIHYATVVLRTDLPAWIRRRCLHEEVIQALGLANDIKDSALTLFDDAPMKRRTELTAHDWMFLEVLYDPRMTPGLHGPALRARASALIAERLAATK